MQCCTTTEPSATSEVLTHGETASPLVGVVKSPSLCVCRNACVDSYRALVLRPDWEKPYYRCSESWMLLGNPTMALQVNGMGCDMCSVNSELCKQKSEILAAMETTEG